MPRSTGNPRRAPRRPTDALRTAAGVLLGRVARRAALRRGGGSAMPGRLALLVQPRLLELALGDLIGGVVLVTGSNGKSTTTGMTVQVLREHGLDVVTNPSGGNLPQGIASALLSRTSVRGRLPGDLAVLEVDEAYGVHLAEQLQPRGALLLNVQADQLDRFHEPGRVGELLRTIASSCREFLVVNADDGTVGPMRPGGGDTTAFAVDPGLRSTAPHGLANAREAPAARPDAAAVVVTALDGRVATIRIGAETVEAALPASGLHYAVDAGAALALSVRLLGQRFDAVAASRAFASLQPVYGRGEVLDVGGEQVEIVMVKNAPSLQLNLDAFEQPPEQLLLAVDEGTPDPSWFFGTDLVNLDHVDVVSGTKAWQLVTRLAYAELPVGAVHLDLRDGLEAFLALPRPTRGRKVALVNYEQMMRMRRLLGFLDLEGRSS